MLWVALSINKKNQPINFTFAERDINIRFVFTEGSESFRIFIMSGGSELKTVFHWWC